MIMTLDEQTEASAPVDQSHADEMIKYGITCVPVDYYYYRKFRYSNLADAIAQAEREFKSSSLSGPAETRLR
jgi:hypothetical protein